MNNLIKKYKELELDHCHKELAELVNKKNKFLSRDFGTEKELRQIFENLPCIRPSSFNTDSDCIRIGKSTDIDASIKESLVSAFKNNFPWRIGPYEIFGIKIDTEWVSCFKWNRIKNAISPLKDKNILDIGSNSGYYMFRTLNQNPRMVLGIEPYIRFYYQYRLLQHYLQADNLFCLPIGIEDMPPFSNYFDTVFCMGILYHRRSPLKMLGDICRYMKKGGELVLETLIIEGQENLCLFPEGRYSKMKNVFFIPTVNCLSSFLRRTGFENIQCIDISKTTAQEQRKTNWVATESLEHFLDSEDPTKTVEGYPAPLRAVIIANKR